MRVPLLGTEQPPNIVDRPVRDDPGSVSQEFLERGQKSDQVRPLQDGQKRGLDDIGGELRRSASGRLRYQDRPDCPAKARDRRSRLIGRPCIAERIRANAAEALSEVTGFL